MGPGGAQLPSVYRLLNTDLEIARKYCTHKDRRSQIGVCYLNVSFFVRTYFAPKPYDIKFSQTKLTKTERKLKSSNVSRFTFDLALIESN